MLFLHTTIAQTVSEMDRLRPLWDRMLAAQRHSVFQRYGWNRLAVKALCNRVTPLIVAVESDLGAAIIPAVFNRAEERLELVGDALFDYRDVLHVGDPEVLRFAWQRLVEFRLPLSVTAIEADAVERWSDFPCLPFANAPEVRSELTNEQQFRSAHPRLARQLRRIQRQGVSLRVHTGDDSALVRYLYTCKSEQFANDESDLFRDPERRELMIAIAAREGKCCEVFTLQTEDEILVAGLLTFREAQWRRFYTIYFDPAWAACSPGILLVYEATARSLGEGLSCDYMTGEYPYKLRFANATRPLYRVEVSAEQMAEIANQMALSSVA